MEKILKQEEIEHLFRSAKVSPPALKVRRRAVQTCDFRQSGQLSKNQVRQVTSLHDNFAPNVSNSLGAYLRVGFQMSLVAVEQLAYSEFLGRLPEQTYFSTALLMPTEETAALQMDLSLVFPMIDLLLGGPGHSLDEPRDLTEIEEQIATTVIGVLWRELQSTWQIAWLIEFSAGPRLKPSQTMSLLPPGERVLNVSFEIQLTDVRGVLNLVFPAVVSNMLLRKLSQQGLVHRRRRSEDSAARIRDRLLEASVTMDLDLAHVPLRIRDIVDLELGQVLPLRHSLEAPMMISINGEPIFSGAPVSCGPTRAALTQSRLPVPGVLPKEHE
ncbi:MAG: flagellar motor switch protein FliM [Candidatus Acidiferrales bacterium]